MAGQVWSVSTSGGYMYALNLSRLLRMAVQPMVKFRQFCDVKAAAHQGFTEVIHSIGTCLVMLPLLVAH